METKQPFSSEEYNELQEAIAALGDNRSEQGNSVAEESKQKLQEELKGYQRPPRKKKRRILGLSAFLSSLLALGILVAFLLNALLAFMDKELDIGDINSTIYAVLASAVLAAIGFLLALTTFFLRRQKKGFAISGLILSLLILLISGATIYGYDYVFGAMNQDDSFDELSDEEIYVVQTEQDGVISREKEEITTLAPEEIESIIKQKENQIDEVEWEHLTDEEIPEEALEKMNTGAPDGPSYLLSGHEDISNYLLFGTDEAGSSDAIMIFSVDRVHHKIKLISIPRDSYVQIPAWGSYAKLAYPYNWGGAEWAVGTINHNFSLNVTEYITVDTIQLADIIDLVGGVYVDLDYAEVNYLSHRFYGINYGRCLLMGDAAVLYARIRQSSVTDNEAKRTGRQREIIMSLLESAKAMPMTDYPEFIRSCLGMCTTSFNNEELMELCVEVVQNNYTIEQYALIDYVDYWGGRLGQERYFYVVYDLNRASDALYRIIYEDLYVSGYSDAEESATEATP